MPGTQTSKELIQQRCGEAVTRQDVGENDGHRASAPAASATVGTPGSAPPVCFLVRRAQIVTMHRVVAVECADTSAMRTASLLQFLLVAYESDHSFHWSASYECIAK